jgi:hypothetical protein
VRHLFHSRSGFHVEFFACHGKYVFHVSMGNSANHSVSDPAKSVFGPDCEPSVSGDRMHLLPLPVFSDIISGHSTMAGIG